MWKCMGYVHTSFGNAHVLEIVSGHANHVFDVFLFRVALVVEEGQVLFQIHTLQELIYAVLQM